MKKGSIVRIAMAIGVVACAGCARTQEVVVDNGKTKVTVSEGGQSLPSGFPLPKYENSKVVMTSNSNDGGIKAATAMLSTKDPGANVTAFYKTFFTTNGWNISNEANMGGSGTFLNAEKGELAAHLVIMTGSDGETSVTMTINTKGQ